VQSQYQAYRQTGVNPWSTSYNPLATFQSTKTREQVRNEFLASRNQVQALTSEDSGSAYLAAHKPAAAPTALGE
jgi:hypothetical protein